MPAAAALIDSLPQATLEWLLGCDNPSVAALTRRTLMGDVDAESTRALWSRRNAYPPVATILDAMRGDGSWDEPNRDYQKYRGSLWQIVFLGEMWADGADARVKRAAEYAFSRQKADGGWSANPAARYHMPCLTANVGRSLARMGWCRDERVIRAIECIVDGWKQLGFIGCTDMRPMSLNGYCHMLTPKVLLLLGEVPRDRWPQGAEELREACVEALRAREVHRCLPEEFKRFQAEVWPLPSKERPAARERFVAEHGPLRYGDKPGWMRFGFPLSYNSDALEALTALMAVGEPPREAYTRAIDLVLAAAGPDMRWKMRNSFNGKMIADVEQKGAPSKWLTLRALQVLAWADAGQQEGPTAG